MIEKSPAPRRERLAVLQASLKELVEAIDRVSATEIPPRRVRWLDRPNRVQSPFDFVKTYFEKEYSEGTLTKNMIREVDRPLYNALNKFHRDKPNDFLLPTLKEYHDQLLKHLGPVNSGSERLSKILRVAETRKRRAGGRA